MKTYFAGVPGGNHREREIELRGRISSRLITFFYSEKAIITLKHFAKVEDESIKTRIYRGHNS